jgi:hypothetical protein
MATTPAGRAALRRIGPTPVHRARWLLKFSAEDVDSLSATAVHDLCQEVTAYIDVGLPRDRALTDVVDPAMVRRCQTWLRDGLHTLKRTNLWKFSLSLPSRCVLRLDERVFYIVSGISTGFYPFQQVFATISAPIFAERLCYCPRSECGRPAEQGTTLLHHSVRAAGTVPTIPAQASRLSPRTARKVRESEDRGAEGHAGTQKNEAQRPPTGH